MMVGTTSSELSATLSPYYVHFEDYLQTTLSSVIHQKIDGHKSALELMFNEPH